MARWEPTDEQLLRQLLAPPDLNDGVKSRDYWRRQSWQLPWYRIRARREAVRMTARWEQRVGAALVSQHRAPLEARPLYRCATRADTAGTMDPTCPDRRAGCRDDRARARGGAGRGGARVPAARVVIEDQRDSRARRGEGGCGDEESCSGITTGIACTRRRDSIARTRDVAVTGRACASARRGRGDHRGHDHRRPETRSSVNAVHRSTRPGSWVEAIPSGADSAAFQPHPSSLVERRRTAPLLTHRAERLGPSMPDWSGFGLGAGFDGWDPPGECERDERKQCETVAELRSPSMRLSSLTLTISSAVAGARSRL